FGNESDAGGCGQCPDEITRLGGGLEVLFEERLGPQLAGRCDLGSFVGNDLVENGGHAARLARETAMKAGGWSVGSDDTAPGSPGEPLRRPSVVAAGEHRYGAGLTLLSSSHGTAT